MIKDYNIKLVNNEEILYVYLDFNSEFANLNSKKNNKKLKDEIKKYISDNDIDFNGITVAIIVGGIMMGTIILNKPNNSKEYSSLSSGTSNIVSIIDNVDVISEETIDEIETGVEVEEVKKEEKEEEKKELNVENKEVINNNVKQEVIKNKEESIEQVESNLTYINIYRSNGTILNIELEEYLIGVVGAEMPAEFNSEALKAQAVVARTYTLRAIESGKRLTDNSSTQNYKSNSELKSVWSSNYNKYYNKVKSAVESTKGMYLTYNGEYIDAVYHSTSNGKTEDSINVWGNSIPYLKSVESVYDNLNKSYEKTVFLNYDEVSNKLNNIVSNETDFNILNRNDSGRVSEIEVNGINYSGIIFRNLLGLRSTDFVIKKTDSGINITTEGYGHGVGMSQYGANGMANNGYNFKDILLHYYSDVRLNYS